MPRSGSDGRKRQLREDADEVGVGVPGPLEAILCQVRAVKSSMAMKKGVNSPLWRAYILRLDHFNWTPGGD